jgi:deoxyribodipyrimidine photo-lyase
MSAPAFGLHWFRRDLRLTGNPALRWNWKRHEGRVLGVFCFDPRFLARADFSVDRFGFFLKTLQALREELRAAGGDLLVLDHGPQQAFPMLLDRLPRGALRSVSWNRDYEPFARERDAWAERYFHEQAGLEVHTERDHLLLEPREIVNASKSSAGVPGYYSVYSPFARRWFEALAQPEIQGRVHEQREALKQRALRTQRPAAEPIFRLSWPQLCSEARKGKSKAGPDASPEASGTVLGEALTDCLDRYLERVLREVRVPLPEAGHAAALKVVSEFSPKIARYKEDRDYPQKAGTSRLSLYLKNGSITSAQVLAQLSLEQESFKSKTGPTHFVKELAWREFYYHILWHRPDVERQSFLPAYRDLEWENDEQKFEAWKQGRTGYPIVDAGMRELAETGWMHNRVRMIVASFLTKDLLIDWKWGERYFMERLLDGDLAPNNGGWQWAASTGCDPQPYFRIFNPELQSRKFDPEGEYIRRFVPELRVIRDSDEIHAPSPLLSGGIYPLPIVDHRERRELALALYRKDEESG